MGKRFFRWALAGCVCIGVLLWWLGSPLEEQIRLEVHAATGAPGDDLAGHVQGIWQLLFGAARH